MKFSPIALLLPLTLLWSVRATAQACPTDEPLRVDTINSVAGAIWDEHAGHADDAAIQGARDAADAVPGRLRTLEGSATTELDSQGRTRLNEYMADVGLTIQLGRLKSLRQDRYEAEAGAVEAEAAAARWAYIYSVQEAFVAWQSAEYRRRHLADYYDEASQALQTFRRARDEQLISELAVADLEAELARIAAERIDTRRASRFARATLTARLGRDCELATTSPADAGTDEVTPLSGGRNPWAGPADKIEDFPSVRAAEARARALEAESESLEASEPMDVSVGVGMRSVGFEENFLTGTLGFTLPLAEPARPDALLRSSEATALEKRSQWLAVRIRAEMSARATRYDALIASYNEYAGDLLDQMQRRVQLLEDALRKGQVEIDRLLRARRDLHEVYHRTLELKTEIQAHQLRAEALDEWLESHGSRP